MVIPGVNGEAGHDRLSELVAEVIGKTQNHPPVRREGGRTRAAVKGAGERGGGGVSKTKNFGIKTFGDVIIGGRCLLPGPPPHDFQVLPAAQSGRETPGAGAPGRAESGATRQALAGARQRWAVSGGSLPPTGHPQHRAEPEGWQGKGTAQARGTGRGEDGTFWLEGNQERIM